MKIFEIILNLGQQLRCRLRFFLFIFYSGGQHLCEIILNQEMSIIFFYLFLTLSAILSGGVKLFDLFVQFW